LDAGSEGASVDFAACLVAEETRLGRRVVVKVLPPEFRAGLSIERFHRETRMAASLRHPHIVPLLVAGESEDGLVYFTMPLIEGESLQRRLEREGRLPLADVVAIVREVADALAYAHANGVVHRDVKPANVLIDAATSSSPTSACESASAAAGEHERPEDAPQKWNAGPHYAGFVLHAGVHDSRSRPTPRTSMPAAMSIASVA
jgi:serine/threonine protein kinase